MVIVSASTASSTVSQSMTGRVVVTREQVEAFLATTAKTYKMLEPKVAVPSVTITRANMKLILAAMNAAAPVEVFGYDAAADYDAPVGYDG